MTTSAASGCATSKDKFVAADVRAVKRRRNRGKQKRRKAQKSRGQRRDADRPFEHRTHPAEEIAPERPQPFVEIDVAAARFRKCRAEFRITKSAAQNDEARHDPRGKHQLNGANRPRHVAGDEKNSGSNGIADHHGSCSSQRQSANEPARIMRRRISVRIGFRRGHGAQRSLYRAQPRSMSGEVDLGVVPARFDSCTHPRLILPSEAGNRAATAIAAHLGQERFPGIIDP